MNECCQYSRTGDGHGRWRCDECGTDMGPQNSVDFPFPLLTEAAGPVRCRDCGTTIERGDPCVDMRDGTGDVLCCACGDEAGMIL